MVFFRVSENINIKTTDGTLVKYLKLRNPEQLLHSSVYVTTYDEFERINKVFERVGEAYKTHVLMEKRFHSLSNFPKELGMTNHFEYTNIKSYENKYLQEYNTHANEMPRFYLDESWRDIHDQLANEEKEEISVAIIGNVGEDIGEMVASFTALHLLYEFLSHTFKKVKLDLFLEASDNKFYSRDKTLLSTQTYISNVIPLALNLQKLCEYDYYVDNSSVKHRTFFKKLSYVDAFLYKFGLDYKQIEGKSKYNDMCISHLKIQNNLKKRIEEIKQNGQKILLFHPYAAQPERSMPKEFAAKFLKKLIKKADGYVVATALTIADVKEDNYLNLAPLSKNIQDFLYIVSSASKVITVDTSTYHISDAFFIPTVVFFTQPIVDQRIAYYHHTKAIYIEDKSKNFSSFKFTNDPLVLYKFESWKSIKTSKVMKILETI